jgi:hypothetical protein
MFILAFLLLLGSLKWYKIVLFIKLITHTIIL